MAWKTALYEVAVSGPAPAVVLATGIGVRQLGTERQLLAAPEHVGRFEQARLMGSDAVPGPLGRFLRAFAGPSGGGDVGSGIRLGVLYEEEASFGGTAAQAAGLHESLDAVVRWLHLSNCRFPLDEIRELIPYVDRSPVLVVGTHTEGDVLGLALVLKRVLGVARVAVSPHLSGSGSVEAHYAAFRHHFPASRVEVLLDLAEAYRFVSLPSNPSVAVSFRGCELGPGAVVEAMSDAERRIAELLCMHWTAAELRVLAGGFSGSLLLLAEGEKQGARTEPMVLKVDSFGQMRAELDGYYRVKDLLGKHVPAFGLPVVVGDRMGVSMELAAMEGEPETLQDSFRDATSERGTARFFRLLEKTLDLLGHRLYGNTASSDWIVPYRELGLHTRDQRDWLRSNADTIVGYLREAGEPSPVNDPERLARLLEVVGHNDDGVRGKRCLAHGDLNFANAICDPGENLWFIDWTHCRQAPLELDFAKLESDAKFVLSADFALDDLSRLRCFEEFLLETPLPSWDDLPEDLSFVRDDPRMQRILGAVARVRASCFSVGGGPDWLSYRVALLRNALHTLSFDRRRGRGECGVAQLAYALYSTQSLLFDLAADDFHLKIRAERPLSYPERQRIQLDEAPWLFESEDYDPPYFVAPEVLANDSSNRPGGWADPEVFAEGDRDPAVRYRDADGRPLNPRGRTGIAGRGSLGRWGANPAVVCLVANRVDEDPDLLVGRSTADGPWRLPGDFSHPHEDPPATLLRLLEGELGLELAMGEVEELGRSYVYDRRQTDHAWVEVATYLWISHGEDLNGRIRPSRRIHDLSFHPLDVDTVNRLSAGHARAVRLGIEAMMRSGRLDPSRGADLLAATG
jgi:ADP-ribose pyrophosphatase